MSYPDILYLLLFLPLSLLFYQLAHRKWRWVILLLLSCVFIFSISKQLILVFFGTVLFTQYSSILMEAVGEKYRKRILILGITVLLAILAGLKYFNFFVDGVNRIASFAGGGHVLDPVRVMVPIGISFYTLEAIGYLVDVYWKKIPAEKNPARLALFLGFFPTVMEGPICRYADVKDVYGKGDPITADSLKEGVLRILWGMFKKAVIADRLNTYVAAIFGNYQVYSGMLVLLSAIACTLQLYMEFSGEIDIVIGSARIFGISLPENFRQPFFSKDASEFWQRWHISLGVWFKTYIFYPVSISKAARSLNRFGRAHGSKYLAKMMTMALALFPVWLCNGLWHGARSTYIFYGMFYFLVILIELAMEPMWKKFLALIHLRRDSVFWSILRILRTWAVIFTGELLFRAASIRAGFSMLASIFKNFEWVTLTNGLLLKFGLSKADILAVIGGCILAAAVDIMKEKKICLPARSPRIPEVLWRAGMAALFFAVVIFGAYGEGYQMVDMIYAGF